MPIAEDAASLDAYLPPEEGEDLAAKLLSTPLCDWPTEDLLRLRARTFLFLEGLEATLGRGTDEERAQVMTVIGAPYAEAVARDHLVRHELLKRNSPAATAARAMDLIKPPRARPGVNGEAALPALHLAPAAP